MINLKFGDRVLIDHKLERIEVYDQKNQNRWFKKWQKIPFSGKFQEGIYLGDRTLSNGYRYRDNTYQATDYINVQLICINHYQNPVYAIIKEKAGQ